MSLLSSSNYMTQNANCCIFGNILLIKTRECATLELFKQILLLFASLVVHSDSQFQVFLELARAVFRDQSHIEPTMITILTNFLALIDCERCQILLSDQNDPLSFNKVFEMSKHETQMKNFQQVSLVLYSRNPNMRGMGNKLRLRKSCYAY